ncbi:MAG: peroxiredoxin family protein [Akkermansiaceae bacterium]|nr:peroxiredoxin family protein [Akkermansiaceae bacterium]
MTIRIAIVCAVAAAFFAGTAAAELPYGLPCLAPLVREARQPGEKPIAFPEIFLDGPFREMSAENQARLEAEKTPLPFPGADPAVARGFACLNGFWEAEAERCFRGALAREPENVAALFGLVLANETRSRRAGTFLKRAREAAKTADPATRAWIEALSKTGTPADRGDWLAALERRALAEPENAFATLWLGREIVLERRRSGETLPSRLGIDSLLRDRGAPAAAVAVAVAPLRRLLWMGEPQLPGRNDGTFPESPFAAPWRIAAEFERAAGRPENAIASLRAAVRADLAWLESEPGFPMPDAAQNLGSNAAALARLLSDEGRVGEAVEVARELCRLPWNPKAPGTTLAWRDPADTCRVAGRNALAEILIRHGRWAELAAGATDGDLANAGDDSGRWRGMAAFHREMDAPEVSADGELARYRKWMAGKAGADEAPPKLPGAGDGHWAELCLETGDAERALVFSEAEERARPHSLAAKALRLRALTRLGRTREALFGFDRAFRERLAAADGDFLRNDPDLAALAKAAGLAADWRESEPKPGPPENFPMPAGPERWEARKAPEDVVFADPNGTEIMLDVLLTAGPRVLMFYLGNGCPYCAEQLAAFAPKAADFEAAGVSLMAVSTDPPARLAEASLPFPVFSDAGLEVFRRLGVFDEFENRPMHGTLVIDAGGRVRWAEISHEPWLDAEFLLKEALRLTKQG